MYVNMAQAEVSNAYEVLKQDFNNYSGTNAYQPGAGGYDTFSETAAEGKTEYYRLTWASSYYSYLEQQGLEKASAPVWDKQLWDSDPNNDGKSDYFSMSIFDVTKIGASVALSLIPGVNMVAAAAINMGLAMAHDTANLAVGEISLDQYGMSMLKSGINGVTGMLTGGIGMGKDMLSFGSEIANGLVSSSISAVGNLATSGLKMNKEGKLDWYMSGSEWSSWGLGSIASVGAAGLNGLGVGKAVGGWTANAFGGGNTGWGSIMGMGVQKATEGFISSSLTSLAKSYDWSTGQWSAYDWKNVAQGTFTGLASGAMTGAVGYMMGGSYADGRMNFNDRYTSMAAHSNVSLFYANQLKQIGNTFGSLAGEATSLAFDGQFTVNLGDGVGIGFGSRGVVRDDTGGVSLGEMLVSARDWKYADFQMKNNWSAAGQSTISYVNLAHLSGNRQADRTAMDIIDGKKQIAYDLDENRGEFGFAGQDNRTIHMSEQGILSVGDTELQQKLAMYTSIMGREGGLIDKQALYNPIRGALTEQENKDLNHVLEWDASVKQLSILADIKKNMNLDVGGSTRYERLAGYLGYSAMTGDQGIFNWDSGRAFALVNNESGSCEARYDLDDDGRKIAIRLLNSTAADDIVGRVSGRTATEREHEAIYKRQGLDVIEDDFRIDESISQPVIKEKYGNILDMAGDLLGKVGTYLDSKLGYLNSIYNNEGQKVKVTRQALEDLEEMRQLQRAGKTVQMASSSIAVLNMVPIIQQAFYERGLVEFMGGWLGLEPIERDSKTLEAKLTWAAILQKNQLLNDWTYTQLQQSDMYKKYYNTFRDTEIQIKKVERQQTSQKVDRIMQNILNESKR